MKIVKISFSLFLFKNINSCGVKSALSNVVSLPHSSANFLTYVQVHSENYKGGKFEMNKFIICIIHALLKYVVIKEFFQMHKGRAKGKGHTK